MIKKLLFIFSFLLLGTSSFGQTVALTGGFNGWPQGGSVVFATTDNIHYTLTNYTLPAGDVKIIVDNNWGNAYGFTTAPGYPSGIGSTTVSNNNITVPAGTYNIAFNNTTKAYSFTAGVNPNAVIHIGGSGSTSSILMSTDNGINYTAKSVSVVSGTLVFSQDGTSNTWGNAAFPSGTATAGGSGIATPAAGTFNISFNKNTGAYAFTPTVVSMIGVGSPSGSWDVDMNMTTTDAITYTLNNVTIVGGTMKIRDNGLWTFQFGTVVDQTANTPFPAGTAVFNGSDMLTQSGTYNITFNRTTYAYNFASALAVDQFAGKAFKAYPNPTTNVWNFSSTNNIESIAIFDTLGKQVMNVTPKNTETTIDASALNSGIYFARITTANASETLKLVKK